MSVYQARAQEEIKAQEHLSPIEENQERPLEEYVEMLTEHLKN